MWLENRLLDTGKGWIVILEGSPFSNWEKIFQAPRISLLEECKVYIQGYTDLADLTEIPLFEHIVSCICFADRQRQDSYPCI